ncbi:MAG: hypothetical protein SW833_10705 [Cyanobacteriota bacterium]|nr:hypothetical protein [Cyanobacteriota bacterium]
MFVIGRDRFLLPNLTIEENKLFLSKLSQFHVRVAFAENLIAPT